MFGFKIKIINFKPNRRMTDNEFLEVKLVDLTKRIHQINKTNQSPEIKSLLLETEVVLKKVIVNFSNQSTTPS